MTSPIRLARAVRLRALPLFLAAIAVLAIAGIASAAPLAPKGFGPIRSDVPTISPGVHVGSIDLSGMDEATARATLTAAFASIGQGQINVTADSTKGTITYAAIDRHVDIDALISQAFAVGRDGGAVQAFVAVMTTAVAGNDLTPTVVFDRAALAQQLATIADKAGTPVVNARAFRTKTGFSATPGKSGYVFDTSAVQPALSAQLTDIGAPAQLSVTLTGAEGQPAITDEAAVAAADAATLMNVPIVLANSGDKWTIPQNVVHSWISFAVVNGDTIQTVFSDAAIQKYLTTLSKKINRDAVSASWDFGPKGVVVVPAKNGRTLNVAATSRRIQVFLLGRGAGTIPPDKLLGPTVTSTPPKLSTVEAKKQASKFKLLSTWTTYFQPAAHNGYGANIWVPAGYLDGQVVQPGDTFSFWGRVGPVTVARGYRMGGAIVNGHTQEGVALAGGICSTSTTLFNAALRAGLKMGERSNHYYYITRYPVGLDATVSKSSGGGTQDMTFTNDTAYPILIKSFKTGGSVTFSLYGIPSGRTISISKPTIWGYTKATSVVIPVNTLPTGRIARIEYPDDGFNSSVTVYVRDANGKLISNRTYISHYGTVQGVQYIGDPNGKPLTVPSYAPGAQGG